MMEIVIFIRPGRMGRTMRWAPAPSIGLVIPARRVNSSYSPCLLIYQVYQKLKEPPEYPGNLCQIGIYESDGDRQEKDPGCQQADL